MAENRMAQKSAAMLKSELADITSGYEALCEADAESFIPELKGLVQVVLSATNCDQSPIEDELLQPLVVPCFQTARSENGLFDDSFVGGKTLAHKALCSSALFYSVGWGRLSMDARRWCRNLLKASLPSDSPNEVVHDFLNAKTFAGYLVSEFLPLDKMPSVQPARRMQNLVDPLIGM